mgnify:CR=1 FL=1
MADGAFSALAFTVTEYFYESIAGIDHDTIRPFPAAALVLSARLPSAEGEPWDEPVRGLQRGGLSFFLGNGRRRPPGDLEEWMLIKGIHHISMKCAAMIKRKLSLTKQLDLFSQRAGAERHPDGIWRRRADHHILWFHKDFISGHFDLIGEFIRRPWRRPRARGWPPRR